MPTNGGMVQYQAQINAASAQKNKFSMNEFAGGLVTDANGKATTAALYDKLVSLSNEARQKFMKIQPRTLGQASRISGVNPSDVQILMLYMGR